MKLLPLIESKRDGGTHSPEEINDLVRAVTDRSAPDYQLCAWLMAVVWRGLDRDETRALTLAMRDSGATLNWPDDGRPVVDKHSTGGVGDKVSLPLAPLLACLGLRVPMISGRGLGITGGTLDKLDSIPGFSTALDLDRFQAIVAELGCAIIGQTPELAPADRRLYALRDASGTVPSRALITASILSKKLAEGLDALVLDVKWGRAAFMTQREDAELLADSMREIGRECGVAVEALLTPMNEPLGLQVGNWLEVVESIDCLEGRGPADLRDLVLECAARLLLLTRGDSDAGAAALTAARDEAASCLDSGAPLERWWQMLEAQGADLPATRAALQDTRAGRSSRSLRLVPAPRSGTIQAIDALAIGRFTRDLGAGRTRHDEIVDPLVGLEILAPSRSRVAAGDPLAQVHARHDDLDLDLVALSQAWTIE